MTRVKLQGGIADGMAFPVAEVPKELIVYGQTYKQTGRYEFTFDPNASQSYNARDAARRVAQRLEIAFRGYSEPRHVGALERCLHAARLRDTARTELRKAIFGAAAAHVPVDQIANVCDRSPRFIQLVLAGKRLKQR